ncbi:NIPSNAP protein [Luteimonas cucumeris]|uniref:NIPSNAP protein n=1 Tax=Luteimonas cucumeris TaxID=985012 RepID=A0A562LEF1_9GAMM|nr:NIPSNAP family protein [Luteimonas cucumeris]TWI06013.1 NIPSNAP protein [Luteimonas cucumeris]
MKRLIEIRCYQLKPGTLPEFHEILVTRAVPMLRDRGMEVVAFGPSPHAADAYFLVRAYDDLADLNAQQDAFYGSEAWRQGPREALLSRIDSFLNTVLWLSPEAIEDMRRLNADPNPSA